MKKFSYALAGIAVIILAFLLYKTLNRKEDIKQAGLIKVRVQLQWFDGAQFAGLYIAKNKKYFEEEGLDVELIPGSYNIDPFQVVSEGRADIGMATGDRVLIQSAEKKDIKAFGTVFNKSIACFMAVAGKVKGIDDFKGKKIGVYRNYDTENILLAMLKQHNINTTEVNIVDAGLIDAFKKGEIDLFPSYRINEPVTMEMENVKVDLFKPEDFGVTFYSDTYFSSVKYWSDNREIIKKFLRASAKGWSDAREHQEESIKTMFSMIKNMTYNENHIKEEKSLAEAVKYLGDGNESKINYMQKEKWAKMEELLVSIGKIKKQGNVDDLCDFTATED